MGRAALRFLSAMVSLIATHSILFGKLDDFDKTQFWIASAAYAILAAIHDKREVQP